MSALRHFFIRYTWQVQVLSAPLVQRMLRGIRLTIHVTPAPKHVFSLRKIREISHLCEVFPFPLTYRAAFLVAFYSFFRISNITRSFATNFDPARQLMRQDIKFDYPCLHIRLKWAKNLQAPERVHWVKLPAVPDRFMCPVQTLQALFQVISAHLTSLFLISETSK